MPTAARGALSAAQLAEFLRVLRPDGKLVLEEAGAAQVRGSRARQSHVTAPRVARVRRASHAALSQYLC